MFQTTTIALCALLLVQLVTAKYATSLTSDAQYLGTGAAAAGGVQDGSQLDLGNMLNLNELVSGLSYQSNGPVSAAIQTRRSVEVRPVKTAQEAVEPHVVDVEATYQPVHVVFRSASSPVMVQQIHTPAQPSQVEPTQSEDEPHRVQHQVLRPVIQEVREIIQPYRRVLQEVRPVLEEVRTVVAKAEGRGVSSNGGEGAVLANGANAATSGTGLGAGLGAGGGAVGTGAGFGQAGLSHAGYASAAASVPAPSYSRGRRSSAAVGAIQRKTFNRRAIAAKRQQLYASSL